MQLAIIWTFKKVQLFLITCVKFIFCDNVQTSLQLDDWVREIDFGLPPHEDLADIHLYCVI